MAQVKENRQEGYGSEESSLSLDGGRSQKNQQMRTDRTEGDDEEEVNMKKPAIKLPGKLSAS